jgi:dTDP-4-dehydrorhamnose reductase
LKKILITGSNGLLGQKLIGLIKKNGPEFLATSFGENRNPELYEKQNYRSLDIRNKNAVLNLVRQFQPDYIFNTAAMTQVDDCENNMDDCYSLNVSAVENLLDACLNHGSSLIHLSTDFVFDGQDGPYKETDIPNPVSYYGWSKYEAEKIIQNSGVDFAIARTILVYGIVQNMSRSNIVLWVKNSLEDGKKIHVVNDQWRTPTLAEDLAEGCMLLATKNANGIFHLSGEEMMNPYDIAIRTADYFKLDKDLIQEADGSNFTQAAKRPPKTGFDISKAKNVLGFQPRSFDEGLEITSGLILKYKS